MSFNIPPHVTLPTSPARRALAIVEIAIFATILPIQVCIRYLQEWRHWRHKRSRNPVRCFLRAWFSLIALLAQIRIVGFALYLSVKDPTKGVVVAEAVLQSVGLSPLLLELSFVLLRCGHASLDEGRSTAYPKIVKRALQYVRLPILVAIILFIVAGSVLNIAFLKAGAVVLLVTFLYLSCITILISITRHQDQLHQAGRRGLRLAIAVLPFYAVRVVYLLLIEFGPVRFDPILGDWRFLAGMGLAMEVVIVMLLIMVGLVAEPL